jgi:hypothetical protein
LGGDAMFLRLMLTVSAEDFCFFEWLIIAKRLFEAFSCFLRKFESLLCVKVAAWVGFDIAIPVFDYSRLRSLLTSLLSYSLDLLLLLLDSLPSPFLESAFFFLSWELDRVFLLLASL